MRDVRGVAGAGLVACGRGSNRRPVAGRAAVGRRAAAEPSAPNRPPPALAALATVATTRDAVTVPLLLVAPWTITVSPG
jgi:hypothetical protein